MNHLHVPGRTKEEKAFDMRILLAVAMVWAIGHPTDKFTWQDSRWMEVVYCRTKWRMLCEAG